MASFRFYKDEKHTIWYRGTFEIEAESYEEAVAKIKQMEAEPTLYDELTDVRWEDLPETLEDMSVVDNDNQPTIEIYSDEKLGDLIYKNA